MGREYIHYGSKELYPVKAIKNERHFTKPEGGLWASPVDAKFGWDAWCRREHFRNNDEDNSFRFKIKDESKIYHIYSTKDLEKLPKQHDNFQTLTYCIDFEKAEKEYDGIELHLSEEKLETIDDYLNGLYFQLYGWDCDSILIFHEQAIEVVN